MLVLGIDMAEKMSAATLLRPDGQVAGEWVCQATHVRARIEFFNEFRKACGDEETHIYCEDVFPRAALTGSYKGAVRFQGTLETLLFLYWQTGSHTLTYWQPTFWQTKSGFQPRTAKLMKLHKDRGLPPPETSKAWAKRICGEIGYEPPPWSRGSKALEDLRDSTLIARYGVFHSTGVLHTTLHRAA